MAKDKIRQITVDEIKPEPIDSKDMLSFGGAEPLGNRLSARPDKAVPNSNRSTIEEISPLVLNKATEELYKESKKEKEPKRPDQKYLEEKIETFLEEKVKKKNGGLKADLKELFGDSADSS